MNESELIAQERVSHGEESLNQSESLSLKRIEHNDGRESFMININPEFIQECYSYDNEWDEEFRKEVASNYPYTMSPKTSKKIAGLSTDLKVKMAASGFAIDPWKIEPADEPYVMGVLRRVMVTDTIEPIIGYTDCMAQYLKEMKERNPEHILSIRSYFCGASVADKCLITRLLQSDCTANLIATDLAADSIAVGALNFSMLNGRLPEQNRYEIHIVKGEIPEDLYGRDKTIVLQVDDAIEASKKESEENNHKFDALLIDNGLQYVSTDFTKKLISNVSKCAGDEGLYIGTLGLDSHIKVEIPKSTHLKHIGKSLFTDLRKSYKEQYTMEAPYKYPHKYNFTIDRSTGNITINEVISDGSARMYQWLGKLVKKDMKKFNEVLGGINSATALSKAAKIVETTPFDYHNAMVQSAKQEGLEVVELESPLDYESFGFTKVGDDKYKNNKNGEILDGGTMMRLCKEKDPLVLRRSRLLVRKPLD